jgi:hypothetical protein
MPGLQVEAWINPASISPRVKKMAQKMIRSGVLTGGYRSTSRMLTIQLMEDACIGLPASANQWGAILYNANLTQDTKAEIINLLEAARMIEIANTPDGHRTQQGYIDRRYERIMEVVRRGRGELSLQCFVMPICQQIAELVAASRSESVVAACDKLADQLDGIEPIKANVYTAI